MIARDGFTVILWTGVALLLSLILTLLFTLPVLIILTVLIGVLFLFHFFFFRDPERRIPSGAEYILSPADGTVIEISEEEEPLYLKTRSRKISIFMSVFNVHVNRMPVTGIIEYIDYKKGQYLAAFKQRASELNEQSVIGLRSDKGPILFKQIAGVVARRIVYHCNSGDRVQAGERFGMIRYGSRVDVFLPLDASINVSLKDKVKGGSTILGEFSA